VIYVCISKYGSFMQRNDTMTKMMVKEAGGVGTSVLLAKKTIVKHQTSFGKIPFEVALKRKHSMDKEIALSDEKPRMNQRTFQVWCSHAWCCNEQILDLMDQGIWWTDVFLGLDILTLESQLSEQLIRRRFKTTKQVQHN